MEEFSESESRIVESQISETTKQKEENDCSNDRAQRVHRTV